MRRLRKERQETPAMMRTDERRKRSSAKSLPDPDSSGGVSWVASYGRSNTVGGGVVRRLVVLGSRWSSREGAEKQGRFLTGLGARFGMTKICWSGTWVSWVYVPFPDGAKYFSYVLGGGRIRRRTGGWR